MCLLLSSDRLHYAWIRAWEGGSTWCLGNMDLHGAPEEASLLQDHLKRSMGDSEPPDIFQHQSTGYHRTRGQETLYV